MTPDDVRARMTNQMPRDQRIACADFLIDNSGDEALLDEQVARAWAWLQGLPRGTYRRRS
jgi:dephospho-CoA kinase